MTLTIDLDKADHERKQKARIRRFRLGFLGFWEEVVAYMGVRTDLMFKKLKRGGSFRGVRWAPFKTAVVARGGTMIGPSGRRVRRRVPASRASLIQDTGNLRREIVSTIFTRAPKKMSFGTQVRYAARQHALRPILFWEKEADEKAIAKIGLRYIVHGK